MGGCGSGRDSEHFAVELSSELSISWMLQQGWLEASGTHSLSWSNCFGGHYDSLTVTIRKSESSLAFYLCELQQDISAELEPMRFGGVRWWLVCPDCSRRCIAIYRAPRQRRYSCRVCLNLTYLSCQQSGSLAAKIKHSEEIKRWRRLNQPPKEIQELWSDENCKRFALLVKELAPKWNWIKSNDYDPGFSTPENWVSDVRDRSEFPALFGNYKKLTDDLLLRVTDCSLGSSDQEPVALACAHAMHELGFAEIYQRHKGSEPAASTLRSYYEKGLRLLKNQQN